MLIAHPSSWAIATHPQQDQNPLRIERASDKPSFGPLHKSYLRKAKTLSNACLPGREKSSSDLTMNRFLNEILRHLRCQLRQNVSGLLHDLVDHLHGKITSGLAKTNQRLAVWPVGGAV